MRILEMVSARGINGVSKHAIELGCGLRKRGHDITFLGVPGSWVLENARNLSFRTIVSDMHRWPTHELRRVASLIEENRIDVVHSHSSKANFFGVLLKWFSPIPTVASAHSCHLQLHWMANDFVIAVSETTRRYHRTVNLVPARRIQTIHNAIDIPLDRSPQEKSDLQQQAQAAMGVSPSDYSIGVVGRICPQKGQLTMIEAMPEVLVHIPNAKLVLIGGFETPEYLKQIHQRIDDFGIQAHVQLLGLREDVRTLLFGFKLIVQPSLWESFPISMLEAMSSGIPIVASNVGGVRECIEHNRSGYLVAPKRPDELSRAIIKLASNPDLAMRLSVEAKRVVKLQFSPDAQLRKVEAVFEKVCQRRPARAAA